MKILVITDPHFGKKEWGSLAENVMADAQRIAQNEPIDLLYFGGDMGDTLSDMHYGFQKLSTIPIKHKIAVAGNHDIFHLSGNLHNYYNELHQIVKQYGVHLLDRKPYCLDDVCFVGNIGWFDGSLYVPPEKPAFPGAPTTIDEVRSAVNKHYADDFITKSVDMTSDEFFSYLAERRIRDMLEVKKHCDKIVFCTHYVPAKDFLLYGKDPRYDFKNWTRGFDGMKFYPGIYTDPQVKLGLAGHTHRHTEAIVGTTKIINVGHIGVVEV